MGNLQLFFVIIVFVKGLLVNNYCSTCVPGENISRILVHSCMKFLLQICEGEE